MIARNTPVYSDPFILMTSAAYELQPRDHAPAGPDPTPADHALVLQEPIGTGGAAVVYRAYDSRLDRLVAVKLLPAAAALDARSRERFLAEIRITAAFDHPHIVSVFGAGTKDDAPYLEMQAITGRSLDQVIADMQALARNGQQLTGETMLQLAQRREPTCAEATTTSESLPRVRATPCYYRQVARWSADVASAL